MALDMSRGKVYWQDKGNASVFYNDSWVDQTGGNIRRANLDGSNVEGLNFSAQNFVLDVTGNDMYFADWYPGYDHPPLGGVGRMNLDGPAEDDYYSDLHHIDQTDIDLDLEDGKIYWTNAHDGTIYRADLEVTTTEQLITGLDYPSEIALDLIERKVYWADGWNGTIRRADIDNPQIENILQGLDNPTGLAIDTLERKIYWMNQKGNIYQGFIHEKFIHRANLDGSRVEELGRATGFAIDAEGGRIAWTDKGGRIHWANVDREDLGSHINSSFISRVGDPYGIALDPGEGKLYWTDLSGAIHVSELDGSNAQVLVTDLVEPRGIALLDGRRIYWADSGTKKIQAASLDGSQVEDIVVGRNYVEAVALDEARSKLHWTEWATIWRSDLDGSSPKAVVDSEHGPISIALDVDRGNLYWTERRSIRRSDLYGSNIQDLVVEDDMYDAYNHVGFSGSHHGIALDLLVGKIYWASLEESMPRWHDTSSRWELTFRCNLDGSQVENIGERGRGADNMVVHHPVSTAVSMPNAPSAPGASSLQQNVPNPFNSTTRVPYHLASTGPVRLEIYNTLGQLVRTLVDKVQPAGFYHASWDARDRQGSVVSAGVYLARLRHPGGMQTRRLLFLR